MLQHMLLAHFKNPPCFALSSVVNCEVDEFVVEYIQGWLKKIAPLDKVP